MKTLAKMIAMIFLLSAGIWLTTQKAQAHPGFGVQIFYDDLRPYGTWVDSPDYGYVWVPDVNSGFQPYGTSGYWTYTFYGWTWVSYYPWGWAPFHYGRWYFDNWYGWVWVPGTEWGPGWVTWRHCDGYYGWAPLTPNYHVDVYVNVDIHIPAPHWVFLPERHFGRRDMDHFYMHRADNDRIFRRSVAMTGTTAERGSDIRYYSGPEVNAIRKATGRDIKPVEIRDASRPGEAMRDGKLEVYRPKTEGTAVRETRDNNVTRYTAPAERNRQPMPPVRTNGEPRKEVNPAPRTDRNYTQPKQEVSPAPRTDRNYTQPKQEVKPAPRTNQAAPATTRKAEPVRKEYKAPARTEPAKQPAARPNNATGKPDRQATPAKKAPATTAKTAEPRKATEARPQSKGTAEAIHRTK